MINNHFPTILGALSIFAAALAGPAHAAGVEDKLQACNACHGQNGEPVDVNTPIIFGQQTNFLVKQLHDYRAGDRDNPIMAAMAKTLTQEELRPAAAYLTSKTWPARKATAAATPPPDGMAVCQICHQEKFMGGAPAPRLAGQSYEYLVEALRRFADGERTNNADMTNIMKAISPAEREAMARFISGL
jgi:cytochrome c553